MKALFDYFLALCRLRAGPQDLPAAWPLFWLILPLNLLAGALLIAPDVGGPDRGFLAALLDLMVILSWVWLLLAFMGRQARYLQTATALLGSNAVLATSALPLQWMAVNGAPAVAEVLLFVVMAWSLVVIAHILRHALEVGLGLAMGLALTYSVVTSLIINLFFPVSGG